MHAGLSSFKMQRDAQKTYRYLRGISQQIQQKTDLLLMFTPTTTTSHTLKQKYMEVVVQFIHDFVKMILLFTPLYFLTETQWLNLPPYFCDLFMLTLV